MEKLYEELGWESLSDRRNYGLAPSYLSDHIPQRNEISLNLRNSNDDIPLIRTQRYENSFFPYTIKSWKNLNEDETNKPSVQSFKKYLNDFIRPPGHPLFGIRDKFGIKLLTKIRASFSDLHEHRFNHNFNCASPTCPCGIEDETSIHFFPRCPHYSAQRSTLLSNISHIIHSDVSVFPDEHLCYILDYGSSVYNPVLNRLVITETITYIRNAGRFTNLEALG